MNGLAFRKAYCLEAFTFYLKKMQLSVIALCIKRPCPIESHTLSWVWKNLPSQAFRSTKQMSFQVFSPAELQYTISSTCFITKKCSISGVVFKYFRNNKVPLKVFYLTKQYTLQNSLKQYHLKCVFSPVFHFNLF